MHLLAARPQGLPAQAQAFCMLLRKVLLNSRLARVERLEGDRVVRLRTTAGELVAELTPRRANLLLLDADGILLGSLLPLRKDLKSGEQYTAPHRPPGHSASVREPRWASSVEMEDFFSDLSMQQQRQGLASRLKRAQKKARRTLKKVEADLAACQEADKYRKWADLLMAQQSMVKGKGRDSVDLPDLFADGQPLTIPLDPRLDGLANAQRLYRKQRKLTTGLGHVQPRLEAAQQRVEELEALRESVANCPLPVPEQEQARVEALCPERRGQKQSSRTSGARRLPYHKFKSSEGLEILVGRGAQENHQLTFKVARGRDLWLHARDLPGCHGLIRLDGQQPPGQASVLDAATLVAHFSKVKAGQVVEITHTLRKNVRPVSGAPGKVYVSEGKTLRLVLDPDRLSGLLARS